MGAAEEAVRSYGGKVFGGFDDDERQALISCRWQEHRLRGTILFFVFNF